MNALEECLTVLHLLPIRLNGNQSDKRGGIK
jgi:hypothetical protein